MSTALLAAALSASARPDGGGPLHDLRQWWAARPWVAWLIPALSLIPIAVMVHTLEVCTRAAALPCTPPVLVSACLVAGALTVPLHRAARVPPLVCGAAAMYALLLVQESAACGRRAGGWALVLLFAAPNAAAAWLCARVWWAATPAEASTRLRVWELYARWLPVVVVPQCLVLVFLSLLTAA